MNRHWITILLLMLIPSAHADELIDPTKPPHFSNTSSAGNFVLTAIMISPFNRLAVINGKIHHVGDLFDDVKITSIEKNAVYFSGPEGNFTLVLQDKSQTPNVKFSK